MSEMVAVNGGALSAIEQYIRVGDMAKLTPDQRVALYNGICESLGLNPLTRPFEFINLQGKLTLYAKKDCTEQLRRIHNISIKELSVKIEQEMIIARAVATTPDGRIDCDYGVVPIPGRGADFANAYLKAITKAKRRVTLSICGLAFLDETELETIPDVKPAHLPAINISPVEFSKKSIALATLLFDEQEYNRTYKAMALKLAGLTTKKAAQFTPEDMESYLTAMIKVWLREILQLSDQEIEEKVDLLRQRHPSFLEADPEELKASLDSLVDAQEVVE